MSEIGIGLIGTGFMGKCHAMAWNAVLPTFGDVPKPVLNILCDLDAENAKAKAAQFGFQRWTTHWREVIDDPKVQVVSITSPNAEHREMALAALAAGKHVWCEKPMALTLDDAEAMANAAMLAPGKTLLGYNYAQNPAIGHARQLIEAGEIGRILHMRGVVDEDYMADGDIPWSWRCRAASAGLGVLGDIMCHLVSIAVTLAGPIAEVCADIDIAYRQRPVSGGKPGEMGAVENEDIAQALVRFEAGFTGVLSSSRVAWGRKNHLMWEVHGSGGHLACDQERMNELQFFKAEGLEETRGFRTILTGPLHAPYDRFCPAPGHGLGFNDLKVIEAAHFLRVIQGAEAPLVDFARGLHIERVIHGIARSARKRTWCRIA
ncbi:Gfo/Idh/MocA family protein [Dongia sp.]|uniref:Gfo/Idh/MocA family protein n=1 Tax=Dongia sp. TaxID=1977262 RepID=UPI0035B4E2F4